MWLRRLWVVVALAVLCPAGCCWCHPHGCRRHCFYPSDPFPDGAATPLAPVAGR